MTSDRLNELIQAVEAERDEFIQQANQRAAYFNGRLETLRALLAEETAPPAPPDAPPVLTEETAA